MKALTNTLALLTLLLGSIAAQAAENTLLKGDWLDQSCYRSPAQLPLSAQTSFKFEGNQVLVMNRYYESDDCSGEAVYAVDYQGTLEVGEVKVLVSGETVTQYSIIIPSSVIESAHLESGITLSSVDKCETKNWSFGDTRDVFSCVFAKSHKNTIKEVALINGNTLYKGMLVTKA